MISYTTIILSSEILLWYHILLYICWAGIQDKNNFSQSNHRYSFLFLNLLLFLQDKRILKGTWRPDGRTQGTPEAAGGRRKNQLKWWISFLLMYLNTLYTFSFSNLIFWMIHFLDFFWHKRSAVQSVAIQAVDWQWHKWPLYP